MIYDISHKHLIGAKLERLIRFYDETRYLVLFGPQYDVIYYRIRYLINQKSGILPLEKKFILHKNQNHYLMLML